MPRDEKHISRSRVAALLLAVLAIIAVGCGGEESASSVASIADVEAPAAVEAPATAEAPTAVEAVDDAVDTPDPAENVDADVNADESSAGEGAITEDETTTEQAADEDELTDEDMALAFVACVREAGFDEMPDPTVNADGSVQLLPPGQQQLLGDPDFQEAAEGCVDLIEEATFFQAAPDISDFADSLLEFAQCLRDNGLDVDDPDLSRFVPGQGARMFGDDFDPQDPANADAIAACQGLLPNAAGN